METVNRDLEVPTCNILPLSPDKYLEKQRSYFLVIMHSVSGKTDNHNLRSVVQQVWLGWMVTRVDTSTGVLKFFH